MAARGIDVPALPYVINMALPEKPEDYIHRIGRVGRAGAAGVALNIVGTVPEKVRRRAFSLLAAINSGHRP